MGSAAEVLRKEHPSGISFGITDGTLDGDSGIVSGIAIPSCTSADCEAEDSDVVIVVTTPAPECQALVEIPILWLAKYTKPVGSAPRNVFEVTPTEQVEAVSTIQSMMSLEDQGRDPNTVTESVALVHAPASTATATSSLPPSQEPFSEVAAIQPEFPIEGLVLLNGDTTIDSDDKEDGKVNKECLRYDFGHGRCPLRLMCCHRQGWLLTPVTPLRYMLYNVVSVRLGYKHWV